MSDLFDKCREFVDSPRMLEGEELEIAAELFAYVSPVVNAGPHIEVEGKRFLQFSSNDYLGLARHPEVLKAAAEAAREYGIGMPMGSRAMTGTTEHHLVLEQSIADFKKCEAAIVFANGAMAMMGAVAALAGPGDVLLMDQCAHATLVCGARISGATTVFFRHNDVEHLEAMIQAHAQSRPAAIVVDGVYSMQGDMAPLPEIVKLKKEYNLRLLVDDAHGVGVFGENGRGTTAHFGVEDDVDLQMGTFSKALGTIGGFASADKTVIEFLRFNAPTYLFSKSMPLIAVAATQKSLELLQKADDARRSLHHNRRALQEGLKANGFDIGVTQSPITPVQTQGNDALRIAHQLRKQNGIWVSPVLYPAVELGKSILRITPTAKHQAEDIDFLLESLTAASCSEYYSLDL